MSLYYRWELSLGIDAEWIYISLLIFIQRSLPGTQSRIGTFCLSAEEIRGPADGTPSPGGDDPPHKISLGKGDGGQIPIPVEG